MKKLALAVGLLLPAISMQAANAEPCPQYGQCQSPPWNGQLMPTWDTPGYYGGWHTGPVQCDPFTLSCRGVVNQ